MEIGLVISTSKVISYMSNFAGSLHVASGSEAVVSDFSVVLQPFDPDLQYET